MKKTFILFVTLILSVWATTQAQTQQGYVKTKGRMVNGQLVPGQGLKGATVSIKDRTTVLVNTDDGAFSFPMPESQFRLDSVRKKGYQLMDMDALSKTYKHSPNPIYLVMETPEQQLQDQLTAERKIRRTLTNQLHQKEDEIEALKEQQKISDEEYRQALQKLYKETDQNEQLVKDMVTHYSTIDYDQLSEFDQRISELILNGELTKADSLLRTKGDINERVSQYRKHEAINTKEKEELAQRQKQLEQSIALAVQERNDLANDCYRKFEIFKIQHQNDSAAYYIELRAGIDTTNIEWLLDAGNFIRVYVSDYEKAMSYNQKALRHALNNMEENSDKTFLCLSSLGELYMTIGDYEKSMDCFQEALELQISRNGEKNRDVARTLNHIGSVYMKKGDFPKTIECCEHALAIFDYLGENDSEIGVTYNLMANVYMELDSVDTAISQYIKVLEIAKNTYGEIHNTVATAYNNIGYAYHHKGDYQKALDYYQRALKIRTTIFGDIHPEIAKNHDNIGVAYHHLGDLDKAIIHNNKALEIRESVFSKNHPDIALSYNNTGFLFYEQKEYSRALEYYDKALNIFTIVYGENHPKTATLYDNIGAAYMGQKDYSKGIEYQKKALGIRVKLFGESHSSLGINYNNIGYAYSQQQDYQKAIEYYNKALDVFKHAFGDSHPNLASIQTNIAKVYEQSEDYKKALEHYEIAKNIRILAFGEDHPKTISVKEKISEVEAKMKEKEQENEQKAKE